MRSKSAYESSRGKRTSRSLKLEKNWENVRWKDQMDTQSLHLRDLRDRGGAAKAQFWDSPKSVLIILNSKFHLLELPSLYRPKVWFSQGVILNQKHTYYTLNHCYIKIYTLRLHPDIIKFTYTHKKTQKIREQKQKVIKKLVIPTERRMLKWFTLTMEQNILGNSSTFQIDNLLCHF